MKRNSGFVQLPVIAVAVLLLAAVTLPVVSNFVANNKKITTQQRAQSAPTPTLASNCGRLLTIVRNALGKSCGEVGYARNADIDKNRTVNNVDMQLVYSHGTDDYWCHERVIDPIDPCLVPTVTPTPTPTPVLCSVSNFRLVCLQQNSRILRWTLNNPRSDRVILKKGTAVLQESTSPTFITYTNLANITDCSSYSVSCASSLSEASFANDKCVGTTKTSCLLATLTPTPTPSPTPTIEEELSPTPTVTPTATPGATGSCTGGCYGSITNCSTNCNYGRTACTQLSNTEVQSVCGWPSGSIGFCCKVGPVATATPGGASPTAAPRATLTPVASVTPGGATPTVPAGCVVCPASAGKPKSLGNANCDNVVDIDDYALWRSQWEDHGTPVSTANGSADFDCSRLVDIADYALWFSNANIWAH